MKAAPPSDPRVRLFADCLAEAVAASVLRDLADPNLAAADGSSGDVRCMNSALKSQLSAASASEFSGHVDVVVHGPADVKKVTSDTPDVEVRASRRRVMPEGRW